MISNANAVRILAEATYVPPNKIDAMSRQLINAGLIPKSAGSRPALMTLEQFARLLLAIHVTSPSKTAVEEVEVYYNLPIDSASKDTTYGTVGENISAILDRFINNERHIHQQSNVMIMLSHPHVTITAQANSEATSRYGTRPSDSKPRSYVEIPPATFSVLAQLWNAAQDAGRGRG